MAVRSMALVCDRLIAGIAGSDPAEGMDVDLLCLLEAFPKFQQATISFVMSIRLSVSVCLSACNNSATTERILIKFDSWSLFRKSVGKIQVSLKSKIDNGYFTHRRFDIYDNNSLNYSWNEICFK